uniref:TAFA chemokine like family member 5 n=1 Tax=Cyprinus carpio TaxID=7962 RepID=A0A8C2CEL6_CYPCA
MAPAVRSIKRKDAINWPRMSTTFWAVLLLTALLIVYCGEFAAVCLHHSSDSKQLTKTHMHGTKKCPTQLCQKGRLLTSIRDKIFWNPPPARIVKTKQWCDMVPCLEDEGCDLLVNKSGWTCTQPSGRVKTTTVRLTYSYNHCQMSLYLQLFSIL